MNRLASERVAHRERLVKSASCYADEVKKRYGPSTVLLYGSVARGDFNLWSDIDVLVVADALPEHPLERSRVLYEFALPGIEAKGYSPSEYREAKSRGLPLISEIEGYCVVLRDDLGLIPGRETASPVQEG